ncbi:unnamed protein product [Rotaria sp. Silwood2]|nr:unnamed protein product [Rotaria sp. Silwood2]
MEDFMTTSQKIANANRKFLDFSRSNHDDGNHNDDNDDAWVTCDQAETILNDLGFKSSTKMSALIGEADPDGLNQVKWNNLLYIIHYFTENSNPNNPNEDDDTNEDNQLSNLPDDEEMKENASDCLQAIFTIVNQDGSISKETVNELAKKFSIPQKQ